jgi:hypothetical protein
MNDPNLMNDEKFMELLRYGTKEEMDAYLDAKIETLIHDNKSYKEPDLS